jgi:hypothetical protein
MLVESTSNARSCNKEFILAPVLQGVGDGKQRAGPRYPPTGGQGQRPGQDHPLQPPGSQAVHRVISVNCYQAGSC